MDIEGYLLGSGIALLIVLLGWADQITSKSKETRELETSFLNSSKVKRTDYRKIVEERGATEDSFNALVDFLYSEESEHAAIFELIVNIRKDLIELDRQYRFRFWALTGLSICLFISGILSFFVQDCVKPLLLAPSLALVVPIFVNLISVYILEGRHNKNIREVMEKL